MKEEERNLGSTNKVLFQEKGNLRAKKNIYYLPCYLRMKLKNITELSLEQLKAQINATLIFSVYYGNIEMSEQALNDLKNKIIFHFDQDEALKLSEKGENLQLKFKEDQKNKIFTYTIRRLFRTRIQCDVFLSPFQIVNLILSITLQTVSVKVQQPFFECDVKFNLMDHPNNFLKCSYSEQGRFGNYDLAEALLNVEYSNNRVPYEFRKQIEQQKKLRGNYDYVKEKGKKIFYRRNETRENLYQYLQNSIKKSLLNCKQNLKQFFSPVRLQKRDYSILTDTKKDKEIKNYQYAHFTVPVYRMPQSTIATIFLPLILLGIINLGIFFQDNNLADRIASIAALMIAFVSLIGTIRQSIPPSPSITFVEIIVYLETFTTILGFIHSLKIRNFKKTFNLKWHADTLFLISLIITVFTFLSVTILYLRHKFIRQPSYNRFQDEEQEVKFDHTTWSHKDCDQYFSAFSKDVKELR